MPSHPAPNFVLVCITRGNGNACKWHRQGRIKVTESAKSLGAFISQIVSIRKLNKATITMAGLMAETNNN